ncbi:dpr18 [Drosophila busckii]|uniref:Dpr18 n=1 Tax=Drosophila busckii TaxID=30019 RepID=A0A0M3QZT5_DROBS|nr:uncharacterized protein LOC108605702 [Drosophila busckii]XP_033150226.1 uncharacterized protein LOC108605702 [Drosophila busckii]ALC49973.1 dpr18 [Drosophila busckii]
MRRLKVKSATTTATTSTTPIPTPTPTAAIIRNAQRHRTQNKLYTCFGARTSPSPFLIWLQLTVLLFGLQPHSVLGSSRSIEGTSTPYVNDSTHGFYFDEQNSNRSAETSINAQVYQLTSELKTTTPPSTTTTTPIRKSTIATGRTASNNSKAATAATIVVISETDQPTAIANSTTIKIFSANTLMPTGQLTTTTKNARSTIRQTIDSLRTRNHWTGVGAVGDADRTRTFRNKYHHENHYGPFFEEPTNTIDPGKTLVAAVHLFTEAVLNCRVGMLKDKTVMWVRRTTEKVSLLTVGNVTYSGDPRIRVKFQYPNNWRLLINPTQREDAGIYMCQVSTHPPRVFTTNLTILEPPLRIIDEHERDVGDRYYKSGSTVDLQCQISRNFFQKERYTILKSTELKLNDSELEFNLIGDTNQTHKYSSQELEKYFTNFITWAKDEEPLHALTNRRFSISDKWLNSRISVTDAKISDSGNYSCSLGRLFTVIVQVQVLTGELPAAVQHNSANVKLLYWGLTLFMFGFNILQRTLISNIKLMFA